MKSYQYLTLERRDHVTVVKFNRPQASNAVNFEFLCEIEHCALAFREDLDTRVVVFAASGRHFSAGADLKEFQNGKAFSMLERRQRLRMGERVFRAILGIDQITVSAWHGGAIGGGGCLAIATDFRIGADNCFLVFPEIDLGFNLMWQSLPRLVRLVGESRAIRLAIGGERIDAETLSGWGLLEKIVPSEEVLQHALTFAQTYVKKAPIAAQMIKRSINAIGGKLDYALMHMDTDQHLLGHQTADHRAAIEAYLNKSTPDFSGN